MDKIQIKNLRSLVDTKEIEIKPLTVLVGKNSTGKSTFLRFFPLMKQTLLTRKNEPILWYGKDYVDFGSFKESISKNKENDYISFKFKFNLNINHRWDKANVKANLEVEIDKNKFNKIKLNIGNLHINISSKEESIYSLSINNEEQDVNLVILNSEFNAAFLPVFKFLPKQKEKVSEENQKRQIYNSNQYFSEIIKKRFNEFTPNEIDRFLNELITTDIVSYSVFNKDFIERINDEIDLEIEHYEHIHEITEENDFSEFLKNITREDLEDFCKLLFGYELENLFDKVNLYFKNYFNGVNYIAPVRASAQRYYRLQGLAVDEIDSQGENIPMVLKHLSTSQKKDFEEWVSKNFKFKITTEDQGGGHVNLSISFDKKNKMNLADTGFGYSQILPIIVLLWRVNVKMKEDNNKKNNNHDYYRYIIIPHKNPYTVVIEQPELHLHPAMQAQLTDVFANCISLAKEMDFELNIIIETHSETIINRLGQLVAREKVNPDLVNVLIFGDSQGHVNTSIKSVKYDSEGIIEDWPIGFFYPED